MSENKICKTTILEDGVQLDFADGRQLTCTINQLPEATIRQSALFGLRRKVVNSFADAKGNVDDAFSWAQEAINQLIAGQWTAPREASAPSTSANSDLLEAIVALTGKDAAAVAEKLDAMTKEQKAALRKNDQVAIKLAEIRTERKKAKAKGTGPSLSEMFQ